MKALAPNTLLQNRYLVVQLIGKGGMGEVYLAVDQRLGSAVALKRTFFSDDEMLGNAFEREAKTLARLRHPVLPKVSDHFTENDTQYLAMEHISGDDLSKRLEISNKPFPLSWVLFWTDQLLDALAYLHSHEPPIVHRDIKPQNLKLTDDNHIVLLDFGLAKNSIGNTRVTSTSGSIVGYTPHYAPMEQIRGTGTNPRSDLYSLAATVYQLLTNKVPPDALTRADSVLNGLPDPTEPLNSLNPEIPKAISDVILKAMSLSMEQRYANAREMQKALREAYAGMQESMAAQTVAFNKSEVENQTAPPAPQQTENLPIASQTAGLNNVYQPQTDGFPVAAQSDVFAPAVPTNDDFDATMRDVGGQDFGMKTEVIPLEKLPRAEDYASPANQSSAPLVNDDYAFASAPGNKPQADDFSFAPEDDFSDEKEKQFDPSATVPLINFGESDLPPASGEKFDSSSNAEKTFISSPPQTAERNYAADEQPVQEEERFVPVATVAVAQKKSGGKGLAIIGGIIAFFVLAVGAAGIGWYVMKPKDEPVVTTTPTPVVESTPTPVPTAEPTVEPTIEANTNTGVSNSSESNTSEITSGTPGDSPTGKKTDVTTVGTRPQNDKPGQTAPVKNQPTPRIVSATNTSRPATPVKTPVAQKTPVKNDRNDILQ